MTGVNVLSVTGTSYGRKVRHPKAEGYNLRIGDIWFRTIASPKAPLQIGTRDSLAERQDRAGSIYENVLDLGYAFSRTDLSGGEGLDFDPRELALFQDEAALDQLRFFSSQNINVARPASNGGQYKLELSKAFEEAFPTQTFTDLVDLTQSALHLYVADNVGVNGTVLEYDHFDDTAPQDSWIPAAGETIVAMAASPADTIMVVLSDGSVWMKDILDTDFASIYSTGPQQVAARGVWYTQGRFLFSGFDLPNACELFAIDFIDGVWTQIDIDDAASPFISVTESGPAVVAACSDGTLRTYTADNAGASGSYELIPRGRTTLPEGEFPLVIGSNANVLLILAVADSNITGVVDGEVEELQTIRCYQAEVLNEQFDYIVGQLDLRRTWFASNHEALVTRAITSTRDEMFFFVRELIDGTFTEAAWRYDLVTQGLSRHTINPGINFNAAIVYDNLLGAIDFTNDVVKVLDRERFQDSGYMVFPNITFGLNTPITWMASVIEAHGLADTGAQVELWRSSDPTAILDWQDPSWILMQRLSSPGATNLEIPMIGVQSRTLALQLRLYSHTSGLGSPKVTRQAMRGIPAHRDFVMMVPVNVSDDVSVPGRRPVRVPDLGYGIHSTVLDLVGKNVQAVLLDPPVLFEGIVNNVSEPVEYLSDRGSVTRYVMVEFRGKRSVATVVATGDSGSGIGLMGIATVGVGQSERT